MKKIVLCLFYLMLPMFIFSFKAEEKLKGRWEMYHPESKKKFGVVSIYKEKGKFFGKIVWLLHKKAIDSHGNKKDLLGTMILRDFIYDADDDEFVDGRIYNPDNGSTYKCYLKIKDKGKILKVRGYVLIPLFGKTIYLYRET